ncbi:hypothetical protein WN51_11740, partial [Melipona quadrifasciata]
GAKATVSNRKNFLELQKEADKKIPRRRSMADIRPIYNCIHKHAGNNTVTVNGKLLSDFQLQQTDVFQEKTKKMLGKERLELEILCSRINCINKLLKPEVRCKKISQHFNDITNKIRNKTNYFVKLNTCQRNINRLYIKCLTLY